MKKFFAAIGFAMLSLVAVTPAFSQEEEMTDEELLSGFDYEPVQAESHANDYRVLGIGYTGNMFFGDADDFNAQVSKAFGLEEIEMPIYMNGFGFVIALAPTHNFSLGFNYSVGSKSVDKALDGELDGYTRYLNYSQSFTNIELNYAYVPFKSFAILAGVNFGLGHLGIKEYQNHDNVEYDEFFTQSDPNINSRNIDGNFYTVEPKLTLQYKLGANLMVQAAAGYNFAFSPTWELENKAEVKNVPDKLKPEGMKVMIGLSIGIFDF